MKSILTWTEKEIKSRKTFPHLGGFNDDDKRSIVILFTEECKGMVVYSENDNNPIGYVSDSWDTDYQLLDPTKTIKLSNN